MRLTTTLRRFLMRNARNTSLRKWPSTLRVRCIISGKHKDRHSVRQQSVPLLRKLRMWANIPETRLTGLVAIRVKRIERSHDVAANFDGPFKSQYFISSSPHSAVSARRIIDLFIE